MMRRREFLADGGRAVIALSILGWSRTNQTSAAGAGQFAELERQIPVWMAEGAVPGVVAIAVIEDSQDGVAPRFRCQRRGVERSRRRRDRFLSAVDEQTGVRASAGGLLTTATDYAKFVIGMLEPRDSDPFRLNRRTTSEMVRPHIQVDASTSWALGWGIQHGAKGDVIFHRGGINGAHSWLPHQCRGRALSSS